jgi:uncharacterized protein YuzE
MRITYDSSVDAAYIYPVPEIEARAVKTYVCDPQEVDALINLDFDSAGHLIGIEVLEASKKLPAAALHQAVRIGSTSVKI